MGEEEEVIGEATLTGLRLQGRHSAPVTECCHFRENMIISLLSETGQDANKGRKALPKSENYTLDTCKESDGLDYRWRAVPATG